MKHTPGQNCPIVESPNKGRIPWNAGKGKGWTDKRGYRWVYVTRSGQRKPMREHRFVMEQHIGRSLEPWELVHHKDQNPSNNDISNLELATWPDHTKTHHIGARRDKALQDAATAFAQMREELKRERSVKACLLAACKEHAPVLVGLSLEYVDDNSDFANGVRHALRSVDVAKMLAAIRKAEGGAD